MSHHAEAIQSLRQQGYRLTPQRVFILNAIGESGGHVSVDSIFEKVHQVYPYIDLATISRALQLLTKLHLVSEITCGRASSYQLVTPEHRHHHMVCEACGDALDLPPQYLDSLREQLLRDVGFEPHMEHFTLSGLCAHCRSQHKQARTSKKGAA